MPSSLKKTEKKIYPESYSIEEEVHKQNSNKTTIVKEVPQSYKKYEKVGRYLLVYLHPKLQYVCTYIVVLTIPPIILQSIAN